MEAKFVLQCKIQLLSATLFVFCMEEEGQSNWELKNIIYSDAEKSSMKLFCTLSQKYILKFQLQNCVGKKKLAHMTNNQYFCIMFCFLSVCRVSKMYCHALLCSIHSKEKNKCCNWKRSAISTSLCNPKDKCSLRILLFIVLITNPLTIQHW